MLGYDLFHGTDSKHLDSILQEGFKCTPDPQDWLGHGVYFFISGITCPHKNAIEWAKNRYSKIETQSISVIKAKVYVKRDKVLDLTTLIGLKKYNTARDTVINSHKRNLFVRRDLNIKKRKDFRVDDQIIMNKVIKLLNVDIVVSNLYIKDTIQRELQLESCLPNSTVISVINPVVFDHSKTMEISRHHDLH